MMMITMMVTNRQYLLIAYYVPSTVLRKHFVVIIPLYLVPSSMMQIQFLFSFFR